MNKEKYIEQMIKELIDQKIKEINTQYISYERLIDAGLIISTTSFMQYIQALESKNKSPGSKWKIYIQNNKNDWLV